MSASLFHIVHVFCVLCLFGVTCAAFAAPEPERKRKIMMFSGIASLGVMLTGFGLLGMLHLGWPGWAFVKMFCWLLLSAMAGQAFRQRDKLKELTLCSLGLVALALIMVYLRPF